MILRSGFKKAKNELNKDNDKRNWNSLDYGYEKKKW